MRFQHVQAQHLARPIRQQVADGDEVAERLRHLGVFELHEFIVQPVIRHRARAMHATRLREFVLVVRKDQVDAAAVNVEDIAEIGGAHRRALDVPARASPAPWAFPARLIAGRLLPQHEIERALLVGIDGDARAGTLLVELAARQRAIVRHRLHIEQDFAFSFIGVTTRDQLPDQRHHVRLAVGARQHEIGRARLEGRRQRAERRHVGSELRRGAFRNLADRLVQRHSRKIARGSRVDLVIDVGDVADIGDVLLAVEMPQQPEQHVEHDDRARIADMGEVIDRRPADIHAHVGGIERREGPLLLGQRIVQAQFHGYPVRCGRASSDLV